tara:strand:- start:850 stop:1014 length:165 start_codon:yes stop_codon:yes gene_type:complete
MSWEDIIKAKSASVDIPKRKIKDRKDLEKIANELDKAVEMHTSQAKRIREIIGD